MHAIVVLYVRLVVLFFFFDVLDCVSCLVPTSHHTVSRVSVVSYKEPFKNNFPRDVFHFRGTQTPSHIPPPKIRMSENIVISQMILNQCPQSMF